MNFLKAKTSYAKNALVQNFMGDKLCRKLENLGLLDFERVFEFGCAQGEFSEKLQKILHFKHYVRNDIVDYGSNFEVELFDMNELSKHFLSTQKFDLIASNACLQWLNLGRVLPSLTQMLNERGVFLFSSFGEKNFEQITQSTGYSLKYLALDDLKKLFEENFELLELSEEFITLEFSSPLELFRHLKLCGVNSLGSFFLGKEFLKKFEQDFKNSLTYHPIYIICRKNTRYLSEQNLPNRF